LRGGAKAVSKLGRQRWEGYQVHCSETYDDDSLAHASEEGYKIPQPGDIHFVKRTMKRMWKVPIAEEILI
jgi:hypothetical protein